MSHYVRATLRTLAMPTLFALLALLVLRPPAAHAQSIDDGLVGYWTFDEGSGPTAADASGSGNTAILHTPGSFTANGAPTDFANPAAFAGSGPDTYARAPGRNIDPLNTITIAFWMHINPDTPPDFMDLVTLGNGKAHFDYVSNQLGFQMTFGPAGVTLFALKNWADGRWHHVAGTFDGATMRLYIDGELQNSYSPLIPQLPVGQDVLVSSSGAPLRGWLDDLRIYNRALTASEIKALVYNCAAVQGIPASECRALVALYSATNGAGWTNHAGWLQNATPCTWAGVLCNNGHVFALSQFQNQLAGPLPPALGNLPELIVLTLSDNRLTGPLPFELGNLTRLQTLDLFGNQLSGQVPFTLGNLAALQTLRLHSNQLAGALPPQLANLTGLLTLDLGYNALTALDPALLTFLSAHQPTWADTQTVPPSGLKVTVLSSTAVSLTWQPISYTADSGYYAVLSAPQATGVYTTVGITAGKSAAAFQVNGLTPGQAYSFVLRTFTPKHGTQQNDLFSVSTDPVVATTPPAPATITIALDLQPNSATNFTFSGRLGAFKLDDISPSDGDAYANSQTFVVPPGVYTVTEQLLNGYLDANIFCSPPAGTIADLANHQIVIDAASGSNLTCTFVAQRTGQIIAGKYNDINHNHARNTNEPWLSDWQMELHSPYTAAVAAQATAGEGRTLYNNLFAGTYTVCEVPKTGWYNITPNAVSPTYNQPCYTFAVNAGQAVCIRFGNNTRPLAATAEESPPFVDIIVCDLPPLDDAGVALAPERDPWEEEEHGTATNTSFLPLISH